MWKKAFIPVLLIIALAVLFGRWAAPAEEAVMSDLSVIVPEATTNLVTNPSIELATTGYSAVGGSIAQSIADQMFGGYSLSVTPGASTGDGVYYGTVSLTNGTTYTFSVYVKGQNGIPYKIYFADSSGNLLGTATTFTGSGRWARIEVAYTAAASANHRLYVVKNGSANTGVFYIDALQVEAKAYSTTYCDGDQTGCSWSAGSHISTSSRSARSTAGGRVVDLSSYNVRFNAYGALGMPPMRHKTQEYAQLPGAYLQGVKIQERVIDLDMWTDTASEDDVHTLLSALNDIFKPDRAASDRDPVILRYTGATNPVEIECNYESGLEGEFRTLDYVPNLSIRLRCYDPYFRGVGVHAASLNTGAAVTSRAVIANIDDVWDTLGPPSSGGTYTYILDMVEGPDGKIYVAGNFLNFNGIAAADYIVMWDPVARTWSALGTGANNVVWALAMDASGNLYAAGDFTTINGVTAAVAKWNGSAWSAVASAATASVYDLAFGRDGTLYAAGAFTTIGGVAANRIAKWNGSAWSALGTGLNDFAYTIAVGPDGKIYVGGDFTTANGVSTGQITAWNGTTFLNINGATNSSVFALAFGPNGVLYAGGGFSTINSLTVNYIAMYTGGSWQALGTGIASGASIHTLAAGSDGKLYAGGAFSFTTGGALNFIDGLAVWNGSTWQAPDVDLPGTGAAVYSLLLTRASDLYVGYTAAGGATSATAASSTTVSNAGKAATYPKIVIKDASGASATLYSIRNTTTGAQLLFNLTMQIGETITIDTDPRHPSVISSYYGNRESDLVDGSDLTTFALAPGSNTLAVLVSGSGATINAYIQWRDCYWSANGAN